jgi:1,5-anhydro-D-fructose reductase (1,5-anhydro-D-mannitol-forming)
MSPPPAIRWGIIGCGDVTEVKSGPGFQKAAGSRLVAVMRRNGDAARDYARRHGVPRAYDDAAELIDDAEVDAVYVATPPSSHRDYALQALAAGKPVYVEKPMACSHDECLSMNAAAEAAGLPLFVAYYRRMLPRFVAVRDALLSGSIGTPLTVTAQYASPPDASLGSGPLPWRYRPEIAGGGLFADMGSHVLDLLDHLLGPIEEVRGFAVNQLGTYRAEDAVAFAVRFRDGVIGTARFAFTAREQIDRVEIAGSDGVLRYATFAEDPFEIVAAGGTTRTEIAHPAHVQQPLIQSIVDELRGFGNCPSTGRSAARTGWVMDRVLAEYRSG